MQGRPIPGLPKLNPNRVVCFYTFILRYNLIRVAQVHATQSIEVVKPLPLVSGEGWLWKTRYTGVAENSEHILHFPVERT